MITENNLSENEENKNPNEVPQEETSENVVSNDEHIHNEETEHEEEHEEVEISLADALKEMEKIINATNAGEDFKKFNQLKEKASHYIHDEVEDKKHEYVEAGNAPENFSYEHPSQAKFSALVNIFREKHDSYQKGQEEEQKKNLEYRQSIIERLKHLYTTSEPGINLFKSIREIKEDWSKAGQVAKSEFKILNNNYFHHLNQFYQMLDLNKEFLEQEYSHNLEKRQHIIERAKQLEHEPVIQKALNELQYLHKLWKEEAEPVAEEFREKTWEEFKEISNKIHERKSELSAAIETEQNENLEKKNQIIAEIKKLSEPVENPNHNYWQNSIRRVEDLRSEFLKTGSVPRKLSNQNWNEFKTILRGFNTTKNTYYKSLKGSQQANLEEKLKLIQTAKDNANNEEWDIAVPLFKKLQEDWKKIGHVPKSMTNKIWDEFRDACNAFFNNYREKSNASTDNWKENYKNKKAILEELKTISNEEGSIERIEAIKTAWNNIGKVPRDKISINTEFNKTLREKLKLNKINELELKEEGLSENQLTDKARKIKSQISDLEAEIVKLENNLAFFKNPSRENLLLKDTFDSIDEKKAHLETLKQNLHSIIAGE
ncbi:protein of unknown function [Chryseobacterium arachidis]|uniref:DUF349 domain-containing protein n=1 Tax=Chryseobacterium arachidis TaxID=1416778 RepID=A0A1M5CYR2_9FLAO|nr:DUF349 domain-containing protein [Chryseobacterium arachidis]SHF59953.1 protein of unknown function [Chryseobacterium arachidis]